MVSRCEIGQWSLNSVLNVKVVVATFNQEGPSRGLLRDYETSCGPSFEALQSILTISAATKIGFYTNFAAIVKTDGLSRVHFGGEFFILYAFQSIESEQQVYTI